MSEENDLKEKQRIQKSIFGRQRKIAMLVQSGRTPENKQKIRSEYKRREKLAEMRKKIRERGRNKST